MSPTRPAEMGNHQPAKCKFLMLIIIVLDMLNVFNIDCSALSRFGIRYLLQQCLEDYLLHEFNSVSEVVAGGGFLVPDMVFIGEGTGSFALMALNQLKEAFPDSKFIVYNLGPQGNDGITYLKSGAQGYLNSNIDSNTLGNCIHTILDGKFCETE